MNFFQIKDDNKIYMTSEIDGKTLLENPQQYVFLFAYRELAIMRAYYSLLARGCDFVDTCNKCEVEWHKPLIWFGATIISHPDYTCYNYIIHESPYIFVRVAPKGQNHDVLMAADKLVMQQFVPALGTKILEKVTTMPEKQSRRIWNALKRIVRTTC